ncbi:ATP-binding protein [Paracoccus contaminans]|uniref:histidine kinase n=1 Tax=Paracoccus contaminans TaxID=1945662 RepID=A0A1W6CXX8_9RHOB|nr:ATP-binding protein [Paracoccus contaminans]ARJ69714.1 hypothetical protein B0A89_08855 [Paracoccus contaminans]
MKRLSSYLFRVAGLSVLVAVGAMFAVVMAGDWWNYHRFEAGLPPALLAEYRGDGPISVAMANALNDFYTSWQVRAVMPVAILLGTLAGGLVGMIHSRRLMRPLDAVAGALEALSAGNTASRAAARPSGVAEIDGFQRNFNAMADEIARAERELRETNAAIAHELRTPLTVLIGRLNGMADGIFPLDPEGVRALLIQTTQLHRIIDDLSLLTLADAGRFTLNREPLDLADLVRDTCLDEGVETDLRPAMTQADPVRLRQILYALLDNARRYGGAGIRVETATEDGAAILRVMDRGPGLAQAQARRVFDRFWRAEDSRGKHSGGSGLGLAVVRSLANAHGGDVSYAAREGGGAVFALELPGSAAGRRDRGA